MNETYEKNLQELREKAAILAASNNLPGIEGQAVIEMMQNLGQMVMALKCELEEVKAASAVVTDDLPGWMRGTVTHYLKTIFGAMNDPSRSKDDRAMINHWLQTTALAAGFLEGEHEEDDD